MEITVGNSGPLEC